MPVAAWGGLGVPPPPRALLEVVVGEEVPVPPMPKPARPAAPGEAVGEAASVADCPEKVGTGVVPRVPVARLDGVAVAQEVRLAEVV